MNEIAKNSPASVWKISLLLRRCLSGVFTVLKKMVTFCTWVVLISIGAHLFGFPCTLCFTLGFLVLRRRTNGYHAKTYIRCLIGSILIECSSIFVVRNAPMEWLILIIVLSNLMVLKVAPVNNKQIHLTAGEMNAMKKEIRKILIGMDILCLLCVFVIRQVIWEKD